MVEKNWFTLANNSLKSKSAHEWQENEKEKERHERIDRVVSTQAFALIYDVTE